jgi:hypothetical protein
MKEKIAEFLEDNGFLPITKWHSFEIIHKDICPEDSQDIDRIRDIVSDNNGLYVYEKDGIILYVGKGKPLLDRIKNHYISSYQEVSGDTKDKKWHRFFSANQGKLRIYWKELEDEETRQVIEKMLDYMLDPKFNLSI